MAQPGADRQIYFLINLVQDVNILRGLAYLTSRETGAVIGFLVSEEFLKRDRQQVWQRELATLARDTGATMHLYSTPADAAAVLDRGSGMIFAASESNIPAHDETSGVFKSAPATFLRVTLQHGFECIGFLQSREHVISHGRDISFTADVICGWFDPSALTSLTAAERSKLYVTGPPTLLQKTTGRHKPAGGGLVCENMHSVRLRASGDHKTSFLDIFFAFCSELEERGETVTLRPHPGGQYFLKNRVQVPPNVRVNGMPLYETDIKAFRFGISAPSTIIFDMVLAGIPVAVWRDPAGIMDAGNYDGLTQISTLDEWLAFERDVHIRPDMFLDRQREFLANLSMPTNAAEVYRRFARLIIAGLSGERLSSSEPRLPDFCNQDGRTAARVPKRPLAFEDQRLVEKAFR